MTQGQPTTPAVVNPDAVAGVFAMLHARQRVAGTYTEHDLTVECAACGAMSGALCEERGVPVSPHAVRLTRGSARARRAAELAEQQLRELHAARLAGADVPGVLVDRWAAGLRPTEALEQAQAWRRSSLTSLVLLGARGIGKSQAAAWIVAEGPRRAGAPDAMWWHASELVALDPRDPLLRTIRRCGILVIDDLGCSDVRTGVQRARLDSVWCPRSDRGLETVVTSNATADEFVQMLDERLRDRLRLHGQVDGLETLVSLRKACEP